MGIRFDAYKLRKQSELEIQKIEDEITDHENYLAANAEPSTPLRMLRIAVAVMKENLNDLKRNHVRFVSRRKRHGQRSAR